MVPARRAACGELLAVDLVPFYAIWQDRARLNAEAGERSRGHHLREYPEADDP
jgi:hypothetical protein